VQALRYPMLLGASDPALGALLTLTPGWFFPGKIFWFVFGIVTGLYLEELQKRFFAYRWHCLAAAAALLPLGMVEWEVLRVQSATEWITYYDTVVDSVYAAAVIITVIAFSRVVPPFADRIEHVGRHSYGVYLVHSIVLVYGARAVYHVVPALLEQGLMFFVFLSLVGLAVPLIAMRVMKESRVKGAYKYVFG
jgi:peptidoglycan/LPS O-acetylase OafA/YrhL